MDMAQEDGVGRAGMRLAQQHLAHHEAAAGTGSRHG